MSKPRIDASVTVDEETVPGPPGAGGLRAESDATVKVDRFDLTPSPAPLPPAPKSLEMRRLRRRSSDDAPTRRPGIAGAVAVAVAEPMPGRFRLVIGLALATAFALGAIFGALTLGGRGHSGGATPCPPASKG